MAALRRDPRYLVAGFLTVLLLVAQIRLHFLEGLGQLATAVGVAVVTELVLAGLYRRRWPNIVSAYMTGVSVGILVRSPLFWPYAAAAALAVGQKYFLTFRGRHLFNPSNFGLCVLLLARPDLVMALNKEWTNSGVAMAVVFAFGFALMARLGRLQTALTYAATFVLLAPVRSWLCGTSFATELAPAFGPPFQLFIFFMITDPRTSPTRPRARIAYALAIAGVEMVLRAARLVDAPFYALFLVSPLFVILEPGGGLTHAQEDVRPMGPG